MLTQKTKSQNFNAISVLDNGDGTGEVIMYMNAMVDENKNLNFNEQIKNLDLYRQNKKMVDSDLTEFRENVFQNL